MNPVNDKLLKPYDPKATEGRIYKIWEDSGLFNPDKLPKKPKAKSYCVMLPPPNVTGSLHMGHAMNATIQDILIRKKRMEGYKTLWLPGTDHAGIATQNVVEKQLKKDGLTRHDIGKEKFIEKIWEWKEKYGDIILSQLKKLGASCDWSRTRFTMDKEYAKAVEAAFLHYHKKGLIYQGDRVVNWCVRCQTSLSDLELEYENIKGKLWYIKYPLKTAGYIIVATTRPETMLGDSAVAVNPKDKRYKDLIGKIVLLPIINREIPIIADKTIEMEFGTGAVKVTPAHDIADFEIGEKHKLSVYKVINQFGKMDLKDLDTKCPLGHLVSKWDGLKTKDAREKIIAELEKQNLIEKIDDYDLRISKCYRCGNIIEPQISKQWFLKMSGLAEIAKKAVKNKKIKFYPKRWEKVYLDWLDNVKDWCVSRQIWWGHKIPLEGTNDVLDTWFSSALWPFATLGWPDKNAKDLKEFYPTQTLSTARDIINLWVARMIFSGSEFTGKEPFSEIIIHPTILTKDGKRMSKSLGTGIDPMILIASHGADATRFGLIFQTMGGQDIHFSEDHIVAGKKFCNKIWNAARFVLERSAKEDINKKKLSKQDKKILRELDKVKKTINKNIDEYKFGHAIRALHEFFWHEFCDKYIEYAKEQKNKNTDAILSRVLVESLKLLHPFMPFITEEIWSFVPGKHKIGKLLIIEKWTRK
ncbi:valine--tRNA ligase [Patescibacteria group bacterium]|nr:valine--tRNA ligase [Patescibacteria group bacterium]MBU4353540.1 valine--tRNA ligase [Patescibacteria group bacterium]MBU4476845.1 valine--tRNA ligase [Patescibacteria group bacterium]MCG2699281.1 valine--tRNA ligase [Candidatus Parcubacteria bacterium]